MGLYFAPPHDDIAEKMSDHPILTLAVNQLNEYFQKERQSCVLPLSIEGTDFQKAVWKELLDIPYGETRSYLDVAKGINNVKAVRAVGQANKANRIPIIIPCHRVIGKNQALIGYVGNQVDKKETLLMLESVL